MMTVVKRVKVSSTKNTHQLGCIFLVWPAHNSHIVLARCAVLEYTQRPLRSRRMAHDAQQPGGIRIFPSCHFLRVVGHVHGTHGGQGSHGTSRFFRRLNIWLIVGNQITPPSPWSKPTGHSSSWYIWGSLRSGGVPGATWPRNGF